jgi:SAM-dependent methyltransferase
MRICSACGGRFPGPGWDCPHCRHSPPVVGGHPALAPEVAEDSEGFEAEYFARLAEMEAGNFWFRSRNRLIAWALGRYFPGARDFLEIGCGTGFVLAGLRREFPALSLSGSEVFSAGLQFAARRLPGVELFQMDARRIPLSEEFDVVGAFDVLEHIADDELVLAQMRAACRPGGGIILTIPQHPSLWSQSDDYARHVRRYGARELREKVERAGFRVERLTSFVSLLLPLMYVSRLRQRRAGGEFDPEAEFRIGRLANSTLEGVLGLERAAIASGLSLPAGGSLLMVARRD